MRIGNSNPSTPGSVKSPFKLACVKMSITARRSCHCRFEQSFHASGTYPALRHHPKAVHFAGSSGRADETKAPPTVFASMRRSTERTDQRADRRRAGGPQSRPQARALMFDQHRFGHHGTESTGPCQSDHRDDQMKN